MLQNINGSAAIGYGGSALSATIQSLKNTGAIQNHPKHRGDGYKHEHDPDEVPTSCRILFVYGDPRFAAVSMFRRQFHHSMPYRPRSQRYGRFSPRKMLDSGIDMIGLSDMWFNWRNDTTHDVMFLYTPEGFSYPEAVGGFLQKEHVELPEPRVNPRGSLRYLEQLGGNAWEALTEIYQDVLDDQADLDVIHYKPSNV